MSQRGTTMKTGMRFTSMSRNSRPATGGNKNISTGARRQSASAQKSKVAPIFRATHAGPYV